MMKILIADDDARMRQILKQIVASLASTVFEASDGEQAVEIYAAQQPDWVLMDFRMKPMDGFCATAQIKARFPEARIVIVSQYDEPELRAEAARLGTRGYVLKENLQELPGIICGHPGFEAAVANRNNSHNDPQSSYPASDHPHK
jgi:CheY-like chemotaxis protein